jgi:Icc-related predicted phosphoesterase
MKIVCISDTHSQISKVEVPEGDLLIISGDATYQGTIEEVSKFNMDLARIKPKLKYGILFTPGNHDKGFEKAPDLFKSILTNATTLIHESIEIEGFKIFASPYAPAFGYGWAYNVYRGQALKDKWAQIPDQTQILISHGPPMGILDTVQLFNKRTGETEIEHVGCQDLYNRIQELKNLNIHVFGHIHSGYGQVEINGVTYVNASVCTEEYRPINKPIVFEL